MPSIMEGGRRSTGRDCLFGGMVVSMSMFFSEKNTILGTFFNGRIQNSIFLSIILLYVLFSLDVATTSMILSLGGYEANMVMIPVVGSYFAHLLLKGLVLVIIGSTAQWAEGRIPRSGLVMLLIIIGWYAFVILNNTSVLIDLCRTPGENPLCISRFTV